MSTFATVKGIKTIRKIFNYTTSNSIHELEKHLQHRLILPETYCLATVNYNVDKGIPTGETNEISNNPEYYPLKFISVSEELWVSCVTAGDDGEGTHGTIRALQMMGFEVTASREEELLSTKNARFEFVKRAKKTER